MNKQLEKYVADTGGVHKPAPKDAHVAVAESAVRDVLQGARVTLYNAGLGATYWPYACRQWVFNYNVGIEGYAQYLQSTGQPFRKEVFGRLVFFKPGDDEKRPKGCPTAGPGCFLGYDPGMRRGFWVAF